jgi:hypothetical protein
MSRIVITTSLFFLFFGLHSVAAVNSCHSIFSKGTLSFAEKISLSKIEQELISAPSKEARSVILKEFVNRHVSELTTERDQKIKQFIFSAKPLGKPLMNALKSVAKSRDTGTLSDAQILKLEKLLLEDNVTKHWSRSSLENLRDFVTTHNPYPLTVEDAILTARLISEDPSLSANQVLLVRVIFDQLVEIKVWSKALEMLDFLQTASDSFAVSRYKLEAEADAIFTKAVESGTISPINQIELLVMRTSHDYFDYLSPGSLPGIERLKEYAWAHLEAHKAKIKLRESPDSKKANELVRRRAAVVNALAGPMYELVLADFLASPQTSSFGMIENLNIRARYAFPGESNDQARKNFILDGIKMTDEP